MALIKVGASDVRLNEPVTFPIYSNSGKLLLNAGHRIHSEAQIERLLANGAWRDDGKEAMHFHKQPRSQQPHQEAAQVLISTARLAPPAQPIAFSAPMEFPRLPQAIEGFELTIDSAPHLRVGATFVGVVDGHGLVVSAPDWDALQPGVTVEGKFLLGRDICTFRSKVVSRSPDFAGLTLLGCPVNVRRHAVRQHRRVPVALPARVIRNDGECVPATLTDLSVEGAGLTLDSKPVERGEHFRLTLRLEADNKTHALMLICIARNVRALEGGVLQVGAQFGQIGTQARTVLRNFVFEAATGTTL